MSAHAVFSVIFTVKANVVMMTEDLTSLFLPQVTSQTLCSDCCNTCICKKIKYICTVHNFFELASRPIILKLHFWDYITKLNSSRLLCNFCLKRKYVTQNKRVLKVTQILTKNSLRYKRLFNWARYNSLLHSVYSIHMSDERRRKTKCSVGYPVVPCLDSRQVFLMAD